jgi:opacity protein-like surface antigen
MLVVSRLLLVLSLLFAGISVANAAHPLITDDTGTQGKGKFQIELNGQFEYEHESGVKENNIESMSTISYGLTEPIDVVLGIPYQSFREREDGPTFRENGFSDASIEVKWRFFEKDGLSLAIKPGISLPVGNDEKGLGSGKVGYSIFFITTKEIGLAVFHFNLGYIDNENTGSDRVDLWHASLAGELSLTKKLRVVGNIGYERGDDPASRSNAGFVLGGFIYSPAENIDLDAGYKYGTTHSEPDHTILAGITYRF